MIKYSKNVIHRVIIIISYLIAILLKFLVTIPVLIISSLGIISNCITFILYPLFYVFIGVKFKNRNKFTDTIVMTTIEILLIKFNNKLDNILSKIKEYR